MPIHTVNTTKKLASASRFSRSEGSLHIMLLASITVENWTCA